MNTWHTHHDHLVHPAQQPTLAMQQARRRRLLGLVLIVVGSIWFGLRLTGWAGDMYLPTVWMEGTGLIVQHLNHGEQAQFVVLAAYGMLTTNTIRRVR